MLHGRISNLDPAVFVVAKLFWIIQVHLYKVLVVAVDATTPVATVVRELAGGDVDSNPDQARISLRHARGDRVNEVFLRLLSQLGIGLVTSEITEASPF